MTTDNNIKAHTQYIGLDGIQVPGVTTILSILNKPALVTWANRLGLQGIDVNKYTNQMADIGTLTHLMILNHLQKEVTDTSNYSKNDITKAENCFLSYLEWEKHHKLEPVNIEKPIVSDKYGYGGTPDFIGFIDDELEVMDFKTGNAIYPEFFYQLAAYWNIASELGHIIKRARILRIGRTDDEGFEERTVKNLTLELDLFLHCLSIYNLKKELKYK